MVVAAKPFNVKVALATVSRCSVRSSDGEAEVLDAAGLAGGRRVACDKVPSRFFLALAGATIAHRSC
jgi:hypothetical protein